MSMMNDYASVADLYDAYVADTRDHAFWRRCAAEASGRILELTAGTGRATIALQRPGARPVVALDLSHAMLRRLPDRFRETAPAACAVCGDATTLPFPAARFGLVVIPFNSFGELTEPASRAAALREMRRVLAPDGRAVVTLHDPVSRRRTLDGVPRALGPFSVGEQCLELLVRGRALGGDAAESEQTYRLLGPRGDLLDERRLTLRFVLPDVESFARMAADAGLGVRSLYGDYDESPYTPGSSPFILVVLGHRERNPV